MRAFVDDYGLGGFEHIADQGGSIWQAFEITARPSFVFIDDDATSSVRSEASNSRS